MSWSRAGCQGPGVRLGSVASGSRTCQNPHVTYVPIEASLRCLCPELTAVVDDATASGNAAAASWRDFGQAIALSAPRPVVTSISESVRANLTYRPVGDPHYWLGEIHCRIHPDWFIALPFGPSFEETTPAAGLPRY